MTSTRTDIAAPERPAVPPARVLILEDDDAEAELIRFELQRSGIEVEPERARTKEEYLTGLSRHPDVILCDYGIPGYDGLTAVRDAREHCPDVPLVVVSGTIGEELAVEMIRQGATDYILKDRLARLGPAVESALEQQRLQADSRRSEQQLEEMNRRFQGLFENTLDALLLADDRAVCVDANPAACELTGYTRDELLTMRIGELTLQDRSQAREMWRGFLDRGTEQGDLSLRRKGGRVVEIEFRGVANIVPGIHLASIRDVTERRRSERALVESQQRFQQLAENVDQAFWMVELVNGEPYPVYVNGAFERVMGSSVEGFYEDPQAWREALHPDDRDRVIESRTHATDGPTDQYFRLFRPDGAVAWIHDRTFPIRDDRGRVYRVAGIAEDVTEAMEGTYALVHSEERLRMAVEAGNFGTWSFDPATGVVTWDASTERLFGVAAGTFGGSFEAYQTLIHPDDRARVVGEIDDAVRRREVYHSEHRICRPDGTERWVEGWARWVTDDRDETTGLIGLVQDITGRKEAEQALQRSVDELWKTNAERRMLLTRLVRAQEEERARIAADIHDDSVQVMTAVGLRLQVVRNDVHSSEAMEQLETLEESVTLATKRLRRLLFELRPRTLDEEGLVPALRTYLEHTASEAGYRFDLHDRTSFELDGETRVVLFRVAQEALMNVSKHAAATHVDVEVFDEAGGCAVRVSDNGMGFDPEAQLHEKRPGHMGLVAMRDRIETARGRWELDSRPDKGTTVWFWLPRATAVA